MKIGCVSAFVLAILTAPLMAVSGDVLQHHVNGNRDGAYVDPLITRKAAAGTRRDKMFNAPIQGPIYAQPLYVSNGPGRMPTLIVATERNAVVALDAATGAQLWTKTLGALVPRSQLPCGNIDPLGITGTPVIDPNSRTIYVAAMTTPDGGRTKQHLIFALSLDDGSTCPGWPVNVSAMKYGGGDYHGWVIAVPVTDRKNATAWATEARGGGVWAPGGIATDGRSIFLATGNTFGARTWMGGEAVVRLGAGAKFSGNPADYFAPSDWRRLDDEDADIGGTDQCCWTCPELRPRN